LQPKPQAQPDRTAWSEFCGLVLEIIAELSPCPKPTLFVVAATRGLQRFGDGTLDDLNKLLARCMQELQARGLVQINKDNLVVTPAGTEHKDILELTNVVESPMDENILVLTSELELYRCPDTGTSDETRMNQKQPQTQTQISNSPEHAPEPTKGGNNCRSAPIRIPRLDGSGYA
jgi:hypothetical protein